MIGYESTNDNLFFMKKISEEINSVISWAKNCKDFRKYQRVIEKEFARYIGTEHSFFTDSGTKAFTTSLCLLGIRKGDEVILPVVTFPSVVLGVLSRGATPVFTEVKRDCTIDPQKIEEKITEKTKVIVPTHMFGHLCDIKEIIKIAYTNNLKVIEDACQAHGSSINGKKAGSFGDIGIFSFGPHKSIGALGGGGITFNNGQMVEDISEFTNVEKDGAWISAGLGNPAMSYADMAILRTKIKFAKIIEQNNNAKRKIYEKAFSKINEIEIIKDNEGYNSIRPSYLIYCSKRDGLIQFLSRKKIFPRLPFIPLNKRNGLEQFCKGSYSNADFYEKNAMLMPLFAMITSEDVNFVCDSVNEFLNG